MTTPSPNMTSARRHVFNQLTQTCTHLRQRDPASSWQTTDLLKSLANMGRAKRLIDQLEHDQYPSSSPDELQSSLDHLRQDQTWQTIVTAYTPTSLLDALSASLIDPDMPDLEKMRWIIEADRAVVALSLANDLGASTEAGPLVQALDSLMTPEVEAAAPIAGRVASFIEAQLPTGDWATVLQSMVDAPAKLAEIQSLFDEFNTQPDPRELLSQVPLTLSEKIDQLRQKLKLPSFTDLLDQLISTPQHGFAAGEEELDELIDTQNIEKIKVGQHLINVKTVHYSSQVQMTLTTTFGAGLRVKLGDQLISARQLDDEDEEFITFPLNFNPEDHPIYIFLGQQLVHTLF